MGQKLTLKEQMKRNERSLKKQFEDWKGKGTVGRQKKLISDIKKNAKAGQMGAVNIMAKDLVRSKRFVQKMIEMRSLVGCTAALCRDEKYSLYDDSYAWCQPSHRYLNRQMNMPQIQKIMREFAMESEKMEMTTEMVGGAIDDAMEDEMDEEETGSSRWSSPCRNWTTCLKTLQVHRQIRRHNRTNRRKKWRCFRAGSQARKLKAVNSYSEKLARDGNHSHKHVISNI